LTHVTTTVHTEIMLADSAETLHRRLLLEESNLAYAALRNDPDLWGEEQAERADWETTLADGLDDDD
jgi:hypothetical protein